jgi:integrase
MPEAKTATRSNDVLTILHQYSRENQAVDWKRTRAAVRALKTFFAGRLVYEIDIPLCREYSAFRIAAGVALSTVARELTTLRAACNHALKWKRISELHKPTFEIPSDLPKREVWLFKDELKILLNAADPIMEQFIRITYGTASRRRAVECLEWYQCDFNRRTIALDKRDARKTNKRRPTVPMGNLYPMLKDMYDQRKNNFVLGSDEDRLAAFTALCASEQLLEVAERDGRPAGRITPHILRHSRATHLLEDGVTIYAVAKLLGDNPTTVQKTYGHISMGSLEDELAKSGAI